MSLNLLRLSKVFRSNFHAFSFSHSNQYRHQSQCFYHLHQIMAQKLDQLIGPHSSPENLKTVVTIPENLPLSDSELEIRPQ